MLVKRRLFNNNKILVKNRNFSFTNSGKANSIENLKDINRNACGIQQLANDLHKQLFPKCTLPGPSIELKKISQKYLEQNELFGKPCSINTPINFKVPTLQGETINQHFQYLGYSSGEKYLELVENLRKIGTSPLHKPNTWLFKSGWTRYAPNEEPKSVPYPLENELVFDCEVMYKQSKYPIMATCLSPLAWYSWCSPYLTNESETNDHLIPLGTDKRECIVVGHNVSYDRARIREEYDINASKAFFIDTMSLHVSVSGMCSRQRGKWMKFKKTMREQKEEQEKTLDHLRDMVVNEDLRYTLSNPCLDEDDMDTNEAKSALNEDPWLNSSSLNKLSDVAEFHCGIKMKKELRDHFATTDVNEIRDLFQVLMTYCADDVIATYHVMNTVFPLFREKIPHPVSFAALRHINTSFLPTCSDWEDYIHRCEKMYQKSKVEIESKVHEICQEVVDLRKDADLETPPWENDPWLSQLDWTIKPIRLTKSGVPYKNQKMPGYPEWYKKLVVKNKLNLTIKTRCCPLLLNLLWENKPIFWTETKGWCFIVENSEKDIFEEKKYKEINITELLASIKPIDEKSKTKTESNDGDLVMDEEHMNSSNSIDIEEIENGEDKRKTKRKSKKSQKKKVTKSATETVEEGEIKYTESDPIVRKNLHKLLDTKKTLYKIPHSDGEDARVTSLITKPFLRYFENDILTSSHKLAREAFQMNVTSSYWVSSRERIMNQFVVYESSLNKNKKGENNKTGKKEVGFIIPQIIPMGTITRRSVEKTWLTASNAKSSRLGSELKSLVQAPPGYCFVGADVDSEELWIASLVGDSVFRLHGGTALGWMTLEGTKNAGTDLHSKTAKILGISRNEAKVFNYGRIYGAGIKFAIILLKKFNPSVTDEEATKVAKTLYAETKGKTGILKLSKDERIKLWYGGSESVVFNRLENIAEQDDPKTPVLGAGITAALNRTNLNKNAFLTSRINWAIQSSGVDYLHLLLVSMEYLCKIYKVDARLAITVHDEVRYMTKKENQYKCAMLLQIANLWTRAMFCYQLGIENIPQSCAFFSCVDIDSVLRKEVDFDCITPSNPNPIPHGESIDIYGLLEKPEIQEMLNSLDDKFDETHDYPISKNSYRPVEELNKKFDRSAKLHWARMQISKTEAEFKKEKKRFFETASISKKEKMSSDIISNDNKVDDVICNGLFDVADSGDALFDSGPIVEQLWDTVVDAPKKYEKRKQRGNENKTDTTTNTKNKVQIDTSPSAVLRAARSELIKQKIEEGLL